MATTQAQTSGNDGFFSFLNPILTGLGEGIGSGLRDVAPRFFEKELGLQQTDQLFNPTFWQAFAQQRVEEAFGTTQRPRVTPALLDFNMGDISGNTILVGAIAVVGLILILRR